MSHNPTPAERRYNNTRPCPLCGERTVPVYGAGDVYCGRCAREEQDKEIALTNAEHEERRKELGL